MVRLWSKRNAAYALLFAVVLAGGFGFRMRDALMPNDGEWAESVPSTHRIEFYSHAIDAHYSLDVWVPSGYGESDERYPVFYQIDPRVSVGAENEQVSHLRGLGEIPEVIVVRVNPLVPLGENEEFVRRARERDWIYTWQDKSGPTGGGPVFLEFLRDGIAPFIDGTYRTVPGDRAVGGFGPSGTFCLMVLFTEPESFTRYVVLAPELNWYDELVWDVEDAYAARRTDLDARVYLGRFDAWSEPLKRQWHRLAEQMDARMYEGLQFEDEVVALESRQDELSAGAARGLAFIYDDQE